MNNFGFILGLGLLLGGMAAGAAQERAGKIEFSDSSVLSGIISLTPGTDLKLQSGSEVRVLALDRVREIRLTPEKEEMERAWRFKEAGQTAKDFYGNPYPVRHLATTITLGGGEKITGHLYTTVLYVADGEAVKKVILLAKQRGKEDETFKQLIYPMQITFGDSAAGASANMKLKLAGLGAKPEVIAITRGALVRLEAKPHNDGEFEMPSPLGKDFFLAAQSGSKLIVGWPHPTDEKITDLIRSALTNSADFFDDRRVLGAFEDLDNSEIYSLVFAVRKGKTHGTSDQTWRLEVYRWKLDDDRRVMLAGQSYFFRGTSAKGGAPPAVELSEKLWKIHRVGEVWVTSGE